MSINVVTIDLRMKQFSRQEQIQQVVVTAEQMRAIEDRVLAAGMPVAALMEKVAGLIVRRIVEIYPLASHKSLVGVLVGPGHNGGDALVVARELHFRGFKVAIYCPFSNLKDLTAQHAEYARSLGIKVFKQVEYLADCNLIIDGLFGFGLERAIASPLTEAITQINQWQKQVFSIDLPSGLHTDTGEVLGIAIKATKTFCLGLWKLGLLQDAAWEYVGKVELIDFDLPLADIESVVSIAPRVKRVIASEAIAHLPLIRPLVTHKYQQGHLLLICGSSRYAGAAILAGLGARASGVGMLSIAVPESIKPLLIAQLPEALIIGCPETPTGAIAELPKVDLNALTAIACGPGLTIEAQGVVAQVLASDRSLILDADGLNILALGNVLQLKQRQAATVLTPHAGEFKRLFPQIPHHGQDRLTAVRTAAELTGAVILLKGAKTAIADATGTVNIIAESTPALARGGSGDVLTGLLGGLVATSGGDALLSLTASAAWWHAQAGILAAQEKTELGVDAVTLSQYLIRVLQNGK